MQQGFQEMSKEEKEALAQKRMDDMRRKNEELLKRYAEIEADKKNADALSSSAIRDSPKKSAPGDGNQRARQPRRDRDRMQPPRAQRQQQAATPAERAPQNKWQTEEKRVQRLSAEDLPPPDPRNRFLADRTRDQEEDWEDAGKSRGGSQRHRRNYGGRDFENVGPTMRHQRDLEREYPESPPRNPAMRMTGRQRREHEQWKCERERIDQERVQRHTTASGEFKREWDHHKEEQEDLPPARKLEDQGPSYGSRVFSRGGQCGRGPRRGGRQEAPRSRTESSSSAKSDLSSESELLRDGPRDRERHNAPPRNRGYRMDQRDRGCPFEPRNHNNSQEFDGRGRGRGRGRGGWEPRGGYQGHRGGGDREHKGYDSRNEASRNRGSQPRGRGRDGGDGWFPERTRGETFGRGSGRRPWGRGARDNAPERPWQRVCPEKWGTSGTEWGEADVVDDATRRGQGAEKREWSRNVVESTSSPSMSCFEEWDAGGDGGGGEWGDAEAVSDGIDDTTKRNEPKDDELCRNDEAEKINKQRHDELYEDDEAEKKNEPKSDELYKDEAEKMDELKGDELYKDKANKMDEPKGDELCEDDVAEKMDDHDEGWEDCSSHLPSDVEDNEADGRKNVVDETTDNSVQEGCEKNAEVSDFSAGETLDGELTSALSLKSRDDTEDREPAGDDVQEVALQREVGENGVGDGTNGGSKVVESDNTGGYQVADTAKRPDEPDLSAACEDEVRDAEDQVHETKLADRARIEDPANVSSDADDPAPVDVDEGSDACKTEGRGEDRASEVSDTRTVVETVDSKENQSSHNHDIKTTNFSTSVQDDGTKSPSVPEAREASEASSADAAASKNAEENNGPSSKM